jgi:hypothetical protein
MSLNEKLTGVLRGRTVVRTMADADQAVVTLSDGSTMTVLLGGPAPATVGGRIMSLSQAGTHLEIAFEGGAAMSFALRDETASVMVRSAAHALEYAD